MYSQHVADIIEDISSINSDLEIEDETIYIETSSIEVKYKT